MGILNHATVGSNDRDKASAFYDAALGALNVNNLGQLGDVATMYGAERPEFLVFHPIDGKPASVANGGTIGFSAPSREAVRAFHEAGIEAGGRCEGAPGPRDVAPNAYAAYLRDPDGNKICAYCLKPE